MAVGAELWVAATLGDAPRGAARLQQVDAGVAVVGAADQGMAAVLGEDHAAAIGGIARRGIDAGFAAQHPLAATGQLAFHHLAAALVVPGGEQHPPAIRREGRLVLEAVLGRRQGARPALALLEPEPAHGVEEHPPPVRRGGHVAHHARGELALRQHLLLPRRFRHLQFDLGLEGNVRGLAAGSIDAPELALPAPDHEGAAIRRPVEVGVGAEDRPALLLVALEAVPERADDAALEVEQVQHALLAQALDEGQGPAVRRGLRPHRAAGAGHQGLDGAGLAVEALDGVDQAVRVLVVLEGGARAHVLAEIDVATIRRDRGFAEVLLVVLLFGEL
ncbi:MAG: hypothetical protein KatS3mg127_2002 [Silanimonas sp.]|nr:MAG: hypothetical protein KatS3mg127_2002 [Silanimonas sp.]